MFWPSPEETSCLLEEYYGSCKIFSTSESFKMETCFGDDEESESHVEIVDAVLNSSWMSHDFTSYSESLNRKTVQQQNGSFVTRRSYRLEEGPI